MNPHNIRTTLIASSLIVAALASSSAHAVLQGRDLNGSAGSFEAYYDTILDITWLADANYAKTSGYDADGAMYWDDAKTWAAQLSFTDGVNVYDDWRLPITTTEVACVFAYSGANCGFNVDPASSEMAHLYFVTLGNQSVYTTDGAFSGADTGGANPNSTLDNVGPFSNFQSERYWFGTKYQLTQYDVWYFGTAAGDQDVDNMSNDFYALAVSPGDVGAVPEAETYALMLAGLGLIGWRARRRG
jgi:hypothetical protein